MSDLVDGGGGVDEEELNVLEKSGVLRSRRPKGKAKARSMNGPKHVVFVEEGEEGPFLLICMRELYFDHAVRYIRRAFGPCPCA